MKKFYLTALFFLIITAGIFCADESKKADTPLIILDAHEDILERLIEHHGDITDNQKHTQANLSKWQAGGINVVWFAIWIDPRICKGDVAPKRPQEMIDFLNEQVKKHPELEICDRADDCRKTTAEGKIAALIGIEGGYCINNDLSYIEKFRKEHVRYMTLTWRGNLDWAGSSQDADKEIGLNDFGRDVIREMNRVGMIADLSHVSDKTFMDVIEVTKKPVIVSHSNCRDLVNHPRNISDEMILAVKKNGGVIGINFWEDLLSKKRHFFGLFRSKRPTIDTVIDHIDHIVKIAGIDHVGIGSDYEGIGHTAVGLEDASCMPKLIDGLKKRGYSNEDIRKIAGENFLRVLKENENKIAVGKN